MKSWQAKDCYYTPYPEEDVEFLPLLPRFRYSKFTLNSAQPVKIFRDGLAVEINSAPVTCRAWLWQDQKLALALAISKFWPKRMNLRFTTRPVVEVSEALRAQFPRDLQVLGCHPTFDPYTERRKTVTVDPRTLPFRTCGAHFHSSFNTLLPEECWGPIAKLSDLLLGAPHTYIFGDALEFKRRTLYGQAGEFRFQNYSEAAGRPNSGVEYRALSSRIYNHPGIFGLFSGIWKYVVLDNYAKLWEAWDPAWEDDLQEAINLGSERALGKVLPLTAKLLNSVSTLYSLKLKLEETQEIPQLWQVLRKMNLAGAFPDAGIIHHDFPEAHTGWGEYRRTWGL
jgi:hypothetical protein